MSSSHLQNPFAQPLLKNSYQAPQTFAESVALIKAFVLQEFDREVAEKQLYYHTHEHIAGVQHRANQIFQVVRPYLSLSEDGDRLELLLDLCAAAHDLIQIFIPHTEPHTPRRREAGVSEAATVERVLQIIHCFNQQCFNQQYSDHIQFSARDLQIIQEAIDSTVCDYDPVEQAIFQPMLYNRQPISLVARILALADIGSLGMDGIEAYNREGTLLFLEENLDVRSLIESHKLESLISENPDLSEKIRQRLLKRAKFQVNFAKSRLKRCPQELEGLPPEAIPVLMRQVFHNLTLETIQAVKLTTPIAEDTPLATLLQFFQFDQVMA